MQKFTYIYLHGYASNPDSSKAIYFANKLRDLGHEVIVPDLNNNDRGDFDFTNLTLTRQLNQVKSLINHSTNPVILIGSSMGGITALLASESCDKVQKIILLAPAINMANLIRTSNSWEAITNWKNNGYKNVIHYAINKKVELKYDFYTDLQNHNDLTFSRNIPCLIFHGINDDVVPYTTSVEYLRSHNQCELVLFYDDHSLSKHLLEMWNSSLNFLMK